MRPRRVLQGPAPAPPYVNPTDRAIVVGIEHYLDGIPTLRGCINDCDLFCHWLTDARGGGLDPARIDYFVSDPGDDKPIRDEVEDLMIGFIDSFNQTVQPIGRRLYIFLSGHGVAAQPPHDQECAIVMPNARQLALRALLGSVTARYIRQTSLFDEVMLVMDCCRELNGLVRATTDLPAGADAQPRPWLEILATRWGSTAAERELPDPFGRPGPPSWQGVLTHALLKGLMFAGDANGQVTAHSLKPYVRKTVEEILGSEDTRKPQIRFDEDVDPMTFGPQRTVPVTIALAPGSQGFEVRHGAGLALVPVVPAVGSDGRTRVFLPPGLYAFRGLDAAGQPTSTVPRTVLEGEVHVTL
jgi:hypothetical protein